ncbi:IS6 family transposase [Roseovarius sp. MBR-78]|uniref:IS6 family transposase n=1 Tax=Roseovarius sp. MBR-78 TaxID=3156460 RepID=UPI003399591C
MQIPSSMPRLKGFRFPREIVAYAVWAYNRFALSTADVEDLLAERGVFVSREAIRLWVNRFGAHFAACLRRDRPQPNDKWHMDEVVIQMGGVKHWLWRAVDGNGDTLDILVQTRRNAKAAKRFLTRLIAQFGECHELCVSGQAHAGFRYGHALKRSSNMIGLAGPKLHIWDSSRTM